jgi:hypothetical protein
VILATRQDVADRLRVPLAEAPEDAALQPLLEEASVMVEEYLRRTYEAGDTVPRAVAIVVSRMVARRLGADEDDAESVPDGVSSLGATDYTASFAEPFVSVGVWLNRTDKMMLRRYRVSAVSIAVSSDRAPWPPVDCDGS